MAEGRADPKETFWVRNYSGANVSLKDIGLTLPAGKSVDLLAHKYNVTLQQLETSLTSGSLFAKRSLIRKVSGPPQSGIEMKKENWKGGFSIRERQPMNEKSFPQYEELQEMEDSELAKLLNKDAEDEEDDSE